MDKSNLDLFKQAISEGLSNRFDKTVAGCTETIACSDSHTLAMRTIVYGKTDAKGVLSPRARRLIAILVAAALILTSCGIIFRNELREIFREFYTVIFFDSDNQNITEIEEIYELTYIPKGYVLEEENISILSARYRFANENGDVLIFEQHSLESIKYLVDVESGCSQIIEIEKYEIYYKLNAENSIYIFNNDKYSFLIKSSVKLSNEQLTSVLDGIDIKKS